MLGYKMRSYRLMQRDSYPVRILIRVEFNTGGCRELNAIFDPETTGYYATSEGIALFLNDSMESAGALIIKHEDQNKCSLFPIASIKGVDVEIVPEPEEVEEEEPEDAE